MSRNTGQRPWNFRRKIITYTLLFDALVILICLFRDIPEGVAETTVASAFYSAMALIGSYVFGAVWEDKAVEKK
jgi:hypothetical protein